MPVYTYTVILEPDADGGYVAFCPSLPGVATEGETVEEALAMARDAITGYLESLREDGLPILEERGALTRAIIPYLTFCFNHAIFLL